MEKSTKTLIIQNDTYVDSFSVKNHTKHFAYNMHEFLYCFTNNYYYQQFDFISLYDFDEKNLDINFYKKVYIVLPLAFIEDATNKKHRLLRKVINNCNFTGIIFWFPHEPLFYGLYTINYNYGFLKNFKNLKIVSCDSHGEKYLYKDLNIEYDKIFYFNNYFEYIYYYKFINSNFKIKKDIQKHVLTLLRRPAKHKLIISSELFKYFNIDNYFYYNFFKSHYKSTIFEFTDEIDIDSIMGFMFYKFFSTNIYDTNNDADNNVDKDLSVWMLNYVLLHLVFETDFNLEKDLPFITEKTYKTMFTKNLFIIAGCYGTIEKLREQGYDVFDDIIDHSYDKETDYYKKIDSIINSLFKFIKTYPTIDDIQKLYKDLTPRLEYNKQNLLSKYNNSENTIKNLMNFLFND